MSIYIPTKKEKHPGLYPFCAGCNTTLNRANIKQCTHDDAQKYRYITRNPQTGKQRTKLLESKDYYEAINEARQFKQSLSEEHFYPQQPKEENPLNMVKAVGKYFDYLQDINVPAHKQKHRSKSYIKQQVSLLKDFLSFLKGLNIDLNYFNVTDVNDNIVGQYYDFLEHTYSNPTTFNHHIKSVCALYNSLSDGLSYEINHQNPFKCVPQKDHYHEVIVIEKEELEQLLNVITPDNGLHVSKCKKNHYFPWLKTAILLGLYTGRREEELLTMKFSDIEEDAGGIPEILNYYDLKSERLKGKKLNKNEIRTVTIPIFRQLRDLINELGYDEYKKSDRFLIAPDITERIELARRMSRAFTHYWRFTGIKKHVTFKTLRKANLTAHKEYAMNNGTYDSDLMVRLISDHKSNSVLQDHYISQKSIAKIIAHSDFSIF